MFDTCIKCNIAIVHRQLMSAITMSSTNYWKDWQKKKWRNMAWNQLPNTST